MGVIAKFKVERVVDKGNDGHDIFLRAVYDPNPESENGRFFKYTPSGEIRLSVVNTTAALQFKEGEEVYVQFTSTGPVPLKSISAT